MDIKQFQLYILPVLFLIVGAIITFLFSWRAKVVARNIATIKTVADEAELLRLRVIDLEAKLQVMGASMTTVNALFQQIIIKELTHNSTPELDILLAKLGPPPTLTKHEEDRLITLLSERSVDTNPLISDTERADCIMLPFVINRVRADLVSNESTSKVLALPTLNEVLTLLVPK